MNKPDFDINAQSDPSKQTLLMVAAAYGNDDLVFELIIRGADLELRDAKLKTALFHASSRVNLNAIELLVAA